MENLTTNGAKTLNKHEIKTGENDIKSRLFCIT